MLGLIETWNIEPFCFPADCGLPVQVKVQAMHCHRRRAACQVQFSQRTSIYSPPPKYRAHILFSFPHAYFNT